MTIQLRLASLQYLARQHHMALSAPEGQPYHLCGDQKVLLTTWSLSEVQERLDQLIHYADHPLSGLD